MVCRRASVCHSFFFFLVPPLLLRFCHRYISLDMRRARRAPWNLCGPQQIEFQTDLCEFIEIYILHKMQYVWCGPRIMNPPIVCHSHRWWLEHEIFVSGSGPQVDAGVWLNWALDNHVWKRRRKKLRRWLSMGILLCTMGHSKPTLIHKRARARANIQHTNIAWYREKRRRSSFYEWIRWRNRESQQREFCTRLERLNVA